MLLTNSREGSEWQRGILCREAHTPAMRNSILVLSAFESGSGDTWQEPKALEMQLSVVLQEPRVHCSCERLFHFLLTRV